MAFYLLQEDGSRLVLESGAGDLILEAIDVGPTVYYQGGDDAPRKKRRRQRRDVFQEMERTIHELLHPPVGAAPTAVPVSPVPVATLEQQLADLVALAGESHGLLQRASRLRADLAALEAQQQAQDEEELLIWMA